MIYLFPNEVQDQILNVTEDDIAAANNYVDSLAESLGISQDVIKQPVAFKVKRLAMVYACYNRCLLSVGTDPTATFDGGQRQDIFAQKLEMYSREVKTLTDTLTVADFTGAKAGGASISLFRG